MSSLRVCVLRMRLQPGRGWITDDRIPKLLNYGLVEESQGVALLDPHSPHHAFFLQNHVHAWIQSRQEIYTMEQRGDPWGREQEFYEVHVVFQNLDIALLFHITWM